MTPLPHPLVVDGAFQTGRFDRPFPSLNALDASPGGVFASRATRSLRLKEWQAFQFSNGRIFGVIALFDTKVLGLVQVKVYDAETRRKVLFERKVPSWTLQAPDQVLDSRMEWRSGDSSVRFETQFGLDRAAFAFDLPGSGDVPELQGRFELDYRGVEPVVVCLPFERGRAMYSQKGVAPLTGQLRVGDDAHAFSPGAAYGLVDDHRGYYPRIMRWDWVTAGGHTPDGTLWGLNLTRNDSVAPDDVNENTLWLDGRAHALPGVTFERQGGSKVGAVWTVRDAQGQVDVRFDVELDGRVDLNFGVVESRYRGPFGRVSGRVAPAGCAPLELEGALAMGERFWLKS